MLGLCGGVLLGFRIFTGAWTEEQKRTLKAPGLFVLGMEVVVVVLLCKIGAISEAKRYASVRSVRKSRVWLVLVKYK